MTPPRLHLPDEPVEQLARWRSLLSEGHTPDEVLFGVGGVLGWFWERWQVLARFGMGEDAFFDVARGHRRELSLWLRGERTYESVASALHGRIQRKLEEQDRRVEREVA